MSSDLVAACGHPFTQHTDELHGRYCRDCDKWCSPACYHHDPVVPLKSREYEVLATLDSPPAWSVDWASHRAIEPQSTAELEFDEDSRPSFVFDGGFTHGGLAIDDTHDASDIVRQIHEVLEYYLTTCPVCGAPGEEAPYTGDKQYCRKHWTTADQAQDVQNAKTDSEGLMALLQSHAEITTFAINNFGDQEGHPIASPENLKYFTLDFARESLYGALFSPKVNDQGHAAAREALAAIGTEFDDFELAREFDRRNPGYWETN